ncbi:MAG: RagB/SusD family nutrient uptake outer membrane protein [Bacteroidota bacterium]
MKTVFLSGIIAISTITFTGCDKWIETPPPNELVADSAIKTSDDLQRLLNSSYNEMANTFGGFSQMMSEMMSDNLSLPNNNDLREVYTHNVLFFNSTSGGHYGNLYRIIFRANFVQDNMDKVSLTEEEKNRFTGEIKFLRALSHFQAVRLYAHPFGYTPDNSHPGIAIVTTASTKSQARKTVKEAYDAILSDLNDAQQLLPAENGNYANRYAAKALLAHVYFQMGQYGNAAASATEVIESGKYQLSDTVNLFTPKASTEYIFAIISTSASDKRSGGYSDNYSPGNPTCQMDKAFYSTIADTSDLRQQLLTKVNAGAANEFIKTEAFNAPFFDVPLLHLTQMHLIRAESLAKTGNDLTKAIDDINAIINRAYTNDTRKLAVSSSATDIIAETRYQRRIELLFQGDRTNEIKRLGAIEGEQMFVRGHEWNCPGFMLQFPITEQTSIFEINPTGGCN